MCDVSASWLTHKCIELVFVCWLPQFVLYIRWGPMEKENIRRRGSGELIKFPALAANSNRCCTKTVVRIGISFGTGQGHLKIIRYATVGFLSSCCRMLSSWYLTDQSNVLWLYVGLFADECVIACIRLFMAALWNRKGHYIFALWFLYIFFFSSPNLSRRRLDVYHTCTHGVALMRI